MALREYLGTLVLLCAFGFFKEVRPSEPYLTQYLLSSHKNLTEEEVYYEIYPVWSYSYFALLIPAFLLTDLVRYKPMIVLEGIAYVVTWILLLWANGVEAMQGMEFVYGIATSTEIAYYTYIYAKVPNKADYQRVSSLTRGATLLGKFMSGLLSQIFVSFDVLDYRGLNYVSLGSVSIALCISLLLPPVKTSIYFHKEEEEVESKETPLAKKTSKVAIMRSILLDAKDGYKNPSIIKWSVWAAASSCIYLQISNYIQPLWEEILPSHEDEEVKIYNGAVEAVTTLASAATVLCVGFLPDKVKWNGSLGEIGILVVAALGGALLAAMSQTETIWMAYGGYVLYRMSYQLLITVATFEVAKTIASDSTGLVFGLNTWAALGLQTALTLTVADAVGLALPVREQFVVYAGLLWAAGLAFAVYFVVRYCLK